MQHSVIDRILSQDFMSLVILASPQITAACLSLASSTVMAVMITCTDKGLTTPFRRIIFGLSISDIIQSTALVTGPFSIPNTVEDSWGIGNDGTCKINGSLVVVGLTAVPMYTCFLCLYYLCKLKYKMENDSFAHKIEWKIHTFIIFYSLIIAMVALTLNAIHPTIFKTSCALAVTPLGCIIYPESVGECDPIIKKSVNVLVSFNNFFLFFACLFVMIGIMVMLSFHAIFLNRMTPPSQQTQEAVAYPSVSVSSLRPGGGRRRRGGQHDVEGIQDSMISTLVTDTIATAESIVNVAGLNSSAALRDDSNHDLTIMSGMDNVDILRGAGNQDHHNNDENHPPSQLQLDMMVEADEDEDEDEESEPRQIRIHDQARHLSNLYKNETLLQAGLYVGSFFLVYLPVIVTYLYLIFISVAPPRYIQFLLYAILPLGGLLNILVYTRPQAAMLKRNFPSMSRLRCLWLVLRAGGDLPTIPNHNQSGNNMNRNLNDNGAINFLDVAGPLPPFQRESISDVQIGLASGHLGGSVLSGCQSNFGIDGMSQSFGKSNPDYNPADNWSYVKGGGNDNESCKCTTFP